MDPTRCSFVAKWLNGSVATERLRFDLSPSWDDSCKLPPMVRGRPVQAHRPLGAQCFVEGGKPTFILFSIHKELNRRVDLT